MANPSYYVVCLHRNCNDEAATFISNALTQTLAKGGAELIVRQEQMGPDSTGLVLHVSASTDRLLEIAEDIDLKKQDLEGVMREFKQSQRKSFPESGIVGPLSLSDIHRCIQFAMESVHFDPDTKTLPGYSKHQVMKRSPVLSAFREAGFIDTFPIHDDESLEKCYQVWFRGGLLNPPIDEIRDYFGENVALYVSFTSFYTWFLIPIALFGISQFVLDRLLGIDFFYNNILFALLNLIAVTIFLEMWKRRSNAHSYDWGTGGKLRHKKARPEFRGDFGLNKVTGRDEVQYPMRKTVQKMLLVSVPITFICLCVAFAFMLASFEADRLLMIYFTDQETGEVPGDVLVQAVLFVPTIIYAILIFVMNQKYLFLAHHLTEWENHRTQEQFERYVVLKLILFEFVNTFLSLFYIAFYLQDGSMLKSQLFTMLIVTQIVNQLQETVLPIFLHKPSTRRVMNKISKKLDEKLAHNETCQHKMIEGLKIIDQDDSETSRVNFSLRRDPFESTYDDFMEIWLQFGHVFLFSSVYPLAGFLALVNNLIELRTDAYKLCRLTRKPTPRSVRDIGAWFVAFNLTSVISVITNCALLAMDKDLQSFAPDTSCRDWVLLFVGIEHVFLCVRFVIAFLIPDVPKRIKDAIDRDDFLLKNKSKLKRE